MGVFNREKKSTDKIPNDVQKFLKEAFSLYAWCIKKGPYSVGETFEEYFGTSEYGREELRSRMQGNNNQISAIYGVEEDYRSPLQETILWCLHEGDRLIWNNMNENNGENDGENDGIWRFTVTYRHKPMKDRLDIGRTVIGTEYDFEEVWTIRNNGEDKIAVISIEDGKKIQAGGGMESGNFEMPAKKMGRIILDKKWGKKELPTPFSPL